MNYCSFDEKRRRRSKCAFSTRRVPLEDMRVLVQGDVVPKSGDLVLARVIELGKQKRLELTNGRRAHLFPGDEIVVAYGNRYAPDQYESIVSMDLSPCDLIAAGGIAGLELCRHVRMLPPTQIEPIGLIANRDGVPLNLGDYGIDRPATQPVIPAILSLGTSMNAGKTLTAASLVRGLKRQGYRVAALKITGTGSGGDMWIVQDAGADFVADFTDAGHASTYLASIDSIVSGTFRLMNEAASLGCDIAVIEIADGLQQLETSTLIRDVRIIGMAIGTLFSAYDSLGAVCGVDTLRVAGHNLFGISGKIGTSPLGVREAEAATGMRYFSPWDLQDGALVPAIRKRAAEAYLSSNKQKRALRRIADEVFGLEKIWQGDPVPNPAKHGSSGKVKQGSIPGLINGRGPALKREDGAQSSLALEVLCRTAAYVMEEEVEEIRLVDRCVEGPDRTKRRNGFRRKSWVTPLGLIDLRIPKMRSGYYKPGFLDTAVQPDQVVAVASAMGTDVFEPVLDRLVSQLSGKPGPHRNIAMLRRDILELHHAVEPVQKRERTRPTDAEQAAPVSYLAPVSGYGWEDDEEEIGESRRVQNAT